MKDDSSTFAPVLHGLFSIVLGMVLLGNSLSFDRHINFSRDFLVIGIVLVAISFGTFLIIQRAFIAKIKLLNTNYYKIFILVLCTFFVRTLILEPTRISSNSMLPTISAGDYVLINKQSFGLKIPFHNKLLFFDRKPTRGEIVVFKYPEDDDNYYIKRLIGLPGDHITYHDNVLVINNQPVQTIPDGKLRYQGVNNQDISIERHIEIIGEQRYKILDGPLSLHAVNSEWLVPENFYFFLGDNRDDSNDSRFLGYVKEEFLVGRPIGFFTD